MWSQIVFLLVGLTLLANGASSLSEEIGVCSERTLRTKYFVPFYEQIRRVEASCFSKALTASSSLDGVLEVEAGFEVHVIRINSTAKNVMLTINGEKVSAENCRVGKVNATFFSASPSSTSTRGIYLLLDSTTPVSWRINFMGSRAQAASTFKRFVFLSPGSGILTSNRATEKRSLADLGIATNDDEAFMTAVEAKLTALSSFFRIVNANRVSFRTGFAAAPECALSSENSEYVSSYWFVKEDAKGCYFRDLAGVQDTDVHVIDLASAGGLSKGHATVMLTISPEKTLRSRGPLLRDLTLVLRSGESVRWYLQSSGIAGRLTVITNEGSTVHNMSLSHGHELEVKAKHMPTSMRDVWTMVESDTGVTPLSYSIMDKANIISMVIPTKSKKGNK